MEVSKTSANNNIVVFLTSTHARNGLKVKHKTTLLVLHFIIRYNENRKMKYDFDEFNRFYYVIES